MNKIKELITCKNKFPLKVNTITIDFEPAIINSAKNVFPNIHLIGCLFHYKQAIRRQLLSLGLYKREYINESNGILKICGKLPFLKNNIKVFHNMFNEIEQDENYKNFVIYFKKQWGPFLKKGNLLDFTSVSKSFRSDVL